MKTDLQKILDTLVRACEFHIARDTMNAHLHLAREPRWSPLTSELLATRDRVEAMLKETSPT